MKPRTSPRRWGLISAGLAFLVNAAAYALLTVKGTVGAATLPLAYGGFLLPFLGELELCHFYFGTNLKDGPPCSPGATAAGFAAGTLVLCLIYFGLGAGAGSLARRLRGR
jgi:hypothetical protein